MFLGTYSPRMDAKGRIILPAKFREELSAGLVLTRGQERCLYVFPAAEFERIHERMRTAPLPGRAARDFLRVFLSGASDELPADTAPIRRTDRQPRRHRIRYPRRNLGCSRLGGIPRPHRS